MLVIVVVTVVDRVGEELVERQMDLEGNLLRQSVLRAERADFLANTGDVPQIVDNGELKRAARTRTRHWPGVPVPPWATRRRRRSCRGA